MWETLRLWWTGRVEVVEAWEEVEVGSAGVWRVSEEWSLSSRTVAREEGEEGQRERVGEVEWEAREDRGGGREEGGSREEGGVREGGRVGGSWQTGWRQLLTQSSTHRSRALGGGRLKALSSSTWEGGRG